MGSDCPIESAALAPGVVQVEGKRKAAASRGGIVTEILAANGMGSGESTAPSNGHHTNARRAANDRRALI